MKVLELAKRSPGTTGLAAGTVYAFVLMHHVEVAPYVWGLAGGSAAFGMVCEDEVLRREPFIAALLTVVVIFVISAIIHTFLDDSWPVATEETVPANRGADVAMNRFIGVMLAVLGVYLVAAPRGASCYSPLFACLAIPWGSFLAWRPGEEKRRYRVVKTSKIHGGSERVFDGDPQFRAWSERVKARFEREREAARDGTGQREESRQAGQREERSRERSREERNRERLRQERSRERSRSAAPKRWQIDDPWAVLGVEPGTAMKKVTQKWRRLCKRYHPDVVPVGLKEETETAVKKINAAYQMIKEQQEPSEQ